MNFGKLLKYYRPDMTLKQIDYYLNYCKSHDHYDNRKRQWHHIIPRNYFKSDSTLTESIKDELMNCCVYLTIKQHEYAHELLGDHKSANFLAVHRTKAYKEKMKKVLEDEWSDPEYRKKIEEARQQGTRNWWKNSKNKEKMKPVQSVNAKRLNSDPKEQFNKKEKLILDCFSNMISHHCKYLTKQNYENYSKHNTPSYARLLTNYCYVLLTVTHISFSKVIKECIILGTTISSNEFRSSGKYPYSRPKFRNAKDNLYMFNKDQDLVYDLNRSKDYLSKIKLLSFKQ